MGVPPLPASTRASAGADIRPCASASISSMRAVPNPSIRSAANRLTCASAPATIRSGGAPSRPSRSTSHPARRYASFRAAKRQVKLAVCPPVTKPTLHSRGRPSRSRSQPIATSSAAAPAGESALSETFWFQAEASQSAAIAAGSPAPTTKPK